MFKPEDLNFSEKVTTSFHRQQAMVSLGIKLTKVSAGQIEMSLPYSKSFTQQHGFMHGGIIATALDSACGYAAFTLMPAEASVLSIEFKVNFLAVAEGDHFQILAAVVKKGRTISVCDATALAVLAGKKRKIATMTATVMAIYDRDRVKG